MKATAKLLVVFTALAALAVSSAQADEGFDDDTVNGLISATYTYITFWPTIAPIQTTQDASANDSTPAKLVVLKKAAVEAAEYIASGEQGPYLKALAAKNPQSDFEDIVDEVLAAAKDL